jgi:hypothetical protein
MRQRLKSRLIGSSLALLMGAGAAFAQVGGGAGGGGVPVAGGASGPPVFGACGTTPSFLGIASNQQGRIQTGGGATTSCALTWTNVQGVATPRIAVPSCEASAEQAATTLVTIVPTVNGLTLTYTSTTAGVLDYHCDGV